MTIRQTAPSGTSRVRCFTWAVLVVLLPSFIQAQRLLARSPDPCVSETLELVARERRAHHLPPLQEELEIAEIARLHSIEMRSLNHIFHDSPTTGSSIDRLRGVSFLFSESGENVAEGYDADSIHVGFMASPGHRENILNPDYTHIGVGTASGDNRVFLTQIFVRIIPRAGPTALVAQVLSRADAIRTACHRPILKRDPRLAENAEKMVAAMFEHDTKDPGALPPVDSAGRLRILTFVGESPDWKTIERECLDFWDSVGVAARQGKTHNWPHGANWYVVLLFRQQS